MDKDIFINLEKIVVSGNVLDIGVDNQGIVYNLYKHYNDEISVDYIDGKEEKNSIEKNKYDSCMLFFTLHKIWFNAFKKQFIKDINCFLKDDGFIYVWDIDKGYKCYFKSKIKILLPDRSIKIIRIKDYNLCKNNTKENIKAMLEQYFDIEEYTSSNRVFFIKAKKKGIISNEGVINSN